MNYQETIDFLFTQTAAYQKVGKKAYKKNLDNIIALCDSLGNPQNKFKSIHIGGTNGKGSTSNLLTSVFMEAGYKVGTYTSPHYLDFRERIKINGKVISEQDVIEFVERMQEDIERIQPSFFELTVAMAFDYFAQQQINIAMVEVGLGGRLDSTNIIEPELSIITNIGLDHQAFLGTTKEEITNEKAGIIKKNTPVIIGKTQEETQSIFQTKANKENTIIYFADQEIKSNKENINWNQLTRTLQFNSTKITTDLLANYQVENLRTVYLATQVLKETFHLKENDFIQGVEHIQQNSPIIGRWQILKKEPLTIADSCHNEDGAKSFFEQIKQIDYNQLHLLYGCVSDKDVSSIKVHFPKDAIIHLTQPSVQRAMPLEKLSLQFENAQTYATPENALQEIQAQLQSDDLFVICGSIFLIADVLS